MMYIHMTFSKKTTPLHSTYLFKIFFSLLTLSTAFLQKASGPGKNGETLGITTKLFDVICHMILIGSDFSEAARGGDRIHKCTESPYLVKLKYTVPTIRAM